MKELYYDLWRILLCLRWPIRLLIELIITTVLILVILNIFEKTKVFSLVKIIIMTFFVIFMTNIVYFILRTSDRAKDIDCKIEEWGRKVVHTQYRLPRKMIFACMTVVYIMAIFVDTPIANCINSKYLGSFNSIKKLCIIVESKLAGDTEMYQVAITELNKNENTEKSISNQMIYINLNELGKNGTNVRAEPTLDASIIGWVNQDSEIVYDNDFKFDGQRYWIYIKVIGESSINGWISGKLIEEEQLNQIIGQSLDEISIVIV